MVRVWDIFVRFSHWLVGLGFLVAYLTGEDALTLHVWAGYAVGALVLLRILWGFIGPKHARFADFVYGPGRVVSYLIGLVSFRAKRYLGHSPAGGAMIVVLWLGLLAVVWSGLELYAVKEGKGPLAAAGAPAAQGTEAAAARLILVSAENDKNQAKQGAERKGGRAWEKFHETLSNLLLALVIMHIAGVILASVAHRENLAWSMITGLKRRE